MTANDFVQRERRNGVPVVVVVEATYEKLVADRNEAIAALQGLLAVENKSWAAYVRQAFANARKVVELARIR